MNGVKWNDGKNVLIMIERRRKLKKGELVCFADSQINLGKITEIIERLLHFQGYSITLCLKDFLKISFSLNLRI